MAAKASPSRVRAWVPIPPVNATYGCAANLCALVERSNALAVPGLESMRVRRADLNEVWRDGSRATRKFASAVGPSTPPT